VVLGGGGGGGGGVGGVFFLWGGCVVGVGGVGGGLLGCVGGVLGGGGGGGGFVLVGLVDGLDGVLVGVERGGLGRGVLWGGFLGGGEGGGWAVVLRVLGGPATARTKWLCRVYEKWGSWGAQVQKPGSSLRKAKKKRKKVRKGRAIDPKKLGGRVKIIRRQRRGSYRAEEREELGLSREKAKLRLAEGKKLQNERRGRGPFGDLRAVGLFVCGEEIIS